MAIRFSRMKYKNPFILSIQKIKMGFIPMENNTMGVFQLGRNLTLKN